jgi:hypothetical protein
MNTGVYVYRVNTIYIILTHKNQMVLNALIYRGTISVTR